MGETGSESDRKSDSWRVDPREPLRWRTLTGQLTGVCALTARAEGVPSRSVDCGGRNAQVAGAARPGAAARTSCGGWGTVAGMVPYPRVREQHIAVFGESGSGKTVLVSSFFGPTQEGSYSNGLWDLVADDTGQGNRLLKNYLGMRDEAKAPAHTVFEATTYYFSVKLKGGDVEAKKRPFDVLRLAWHDYPGEWWEVSPTGDGEADRRVDTFRSLLRSDVAILLVDGQKLLDYNGEEQRYLKSLLSTFRQGILRLKDDLLAGQERLVEFPRIWILALSKADLFPDWDINSFRDLLILKAADDIDALRDTIADLVDTPGALSIGEDFMLLSSAKFELAPADDEPLGIDVTQQVGLDLILPVASILPLERRVQWSERMEIPRRVLDTLADGADALALALSAGQMFGIDKILIKFPKVGPFVKRPALLALAAAAKATGDQLKHVNAQAREQHDYLTATLTQFKMDLEQGVTDKLLIRSLK